MNIKHSSNLSINQKNKINNESILVVHLNELILTGTKNVFTYKDAYNKK